MHSKTLIKMNKSKPFLQSCTKHGQMKTNLKQENERIAQIESTYFAIEKSELIKKKSQLSDHAIWRGFSRVYIMWVQGLRPPKGGPHIIQ